MGPLYSNPPPLLTSANLVVSLEGMDSMGAFISGEQADKPAFPPLEVLPECTPGHLLFEFQFLFRIAGYVEKDVIITPEPERYRLCRHHQVFYHFSAAKLAHDSGHQFSLVGQEKHDIPELLAGVELQRQLGDYPRGAEPAEKQAAQVRQRRALGEPVRRDRAGADPAFFPGGQHHLQAADHVGVEPVLLRQASLAVYYRVGCYGCDRRRIRYAVT